MWTPVEPKQKEDQRIFSFWMEMCISRILYNNDIIVYIMYIFMCIYSVYIYNNGRAFDTLQKVVLGF